MDPVLREALTFVAPGVIHRLGNNLFAIQGHAQLLADAGEQGRERTAILAAADKGNRALGLLRAMWDREPAQPADAGELLGRLTEVLGLPVRERGHTIEARIPDDGAFRGVTPGVFCPLVIEAVRLLVAVQPAGHGGRLHVELTDDRPGVLVRARFLPREGALPFPLAVAEVRAGLLRVARELRPPAAVQVSEGGVELAFGAAAARAREEEA